MWNTVKTWCLNVNCHFYYKYKAILHFGIDSLSVITKVNIHGTSELAISLRLGFTDKVSKSSWKHMNIEYHWNFSLNFKKMTKVLHEHNVNDGEV